MSFPGPDPLYRIDGLSRAAHSGAQPSKKEEEVHADVPVCVSCGHGHARVL